MMAKVRECVIDTVVLQKTNAPLAHAPRPHAKIRVRLQLLKRIRQGNLVVLASKNLLEEYKRQITTPRNDYVQAFFALLDSNTVQWNWEKRWPGGDRARARKCRYPKEDDHVLRTAIRPHPSYIVTEEGRMLKADQCIYRQFHVHIVEPDSI